MRQYNVYILGLDDFNLRKLRGIPGAAECRFIGVLDSQEILEADHFPVADMLRRAEQRMAGSGEPVDAVIGYVDFPVSTMIPVLAQRFGLRAPSLTALLRCEHKYWSRLCQREVVPDNIPRFEVFDPFEPDPLAGLSLDFPFWIKPIKSAGSFLGFRIDDANAFHAAIEQIRAHIGIFAEPFNHILGLAELPDEVARVDGHFCIAESIIGGRQCTLEGFVFDGAVHFHGVIDSIRARNASTFLRYQYPSRLPDRVIRRMEAITERVLTHIGFDQSAFNVEFFWDRHADQVWLLEINTRIAQHHSDLFEKVDGASNHAVVVDVALGREPRFAHGHGPHNFAACCFLRHYSDGVVEDVPPPAEITALQAEFPGFTYEPHVQPGTRLSALTHQDSYSYVLALIYLGGASPQRLREAYRECRRRLRFHIRTLDREGFICDG
ncbi:ATP-grasp domain-containing protein [Arhodomonas sp. AD133]|uniref:ATP-grasp domain-containing protein n=1 Tax=Arhodomonas sp. AD133 TaxID=3415009 RepID=UPI003EBE67D4